MKNASIILLTTLSCLGTSNLAAAQNFESPQNADAVTQTNTYVLKDAMESASVFTSQALVNAPTGQQILFAEGAGGAEKSVQDEAAAQVLAIQRMLEAANPQ